MVTYSKWDSKKVIQVFEVKTSNCVEKANHVHVTKYHRECAVPKNIRTSPEGQWNSKVEGGGNSRSFKRNVWR